MKTFGHMRPVRDAATGEITGSKVSPAKARTVKTLGAGYGPDADKRLVVSLEAQDLIVLRPEKTHRAVNITAKDLYAHLLRLQAGREWLAGKPRKWNRLNRQNGVT